MREDLIYGIHVILRLLDKNPEQLLELYLTEERFDKPIQEIEKKAKNFNIPIQRVSKKQLDNWLPEQNHQSVAAKIKKQSILTEHDLSDLLNAKQSSPPFFLVLDSVQDPHNLGACLRTADATNVTGVIFPKDRSAQVTPIVRKVASGAAESVPLFQVTNLVRTLEKLKEAGVWIIGTSLNTNKTVFEMDLSGPIAIVLGAEGTGLRRLTEESCDLLMQIPMLGVVESLNVSVAAGVCLYEAVRQRQYYNYRK